MPIDKSADDWKARYKPITDWDRMFADGEWDYLDHPGESARYALIAGYIHRHSNAVEVLDVGCGTGVLYRYLDQSRVKYRGFDISPVAVGRALDLFPQAKFAAIDIASYAPESEDFDVIVFNEVLQCVDDPLGYISRFLKFLKPGGYCVISTYQNTDSGSNAAMFTDILNQALRDGRFEALTGCEIRTFNDGLKWRVDVVSADENNGSN